MTTDFSPKTEGSTKPEALQNRRLYETEGSTKPKALQNLGVLSF